ncbi:MAG: BatD family protein [Deltaproteobacteria bacterium]|nr:BatD family protein [Deltaproteobacteria bacterium]
MKRIACCLIFFSTLILISLPVAAEVSVTLNLDRREATLTDSVELQVRVSGTRSSDAPPVIEGLKPFHVIQGGSASRVEFINGRYNSFVDYTYYLQPKEKGVFRVGPAAAEVDGKTYQSDAATLKVVAGDDGSGSKREAVFLTASLGSKKAYVEQQVPYTLKLYLRTNVSDISLDLPDAGEFTFRQLEKPKEYQTVYEGASYRVLEVSYGVMPLKPGSFRIPPARMGLTVYSARKRTPRGLFDDPFFGGALRSGRPLTVSSEPLALEVLPFPEKGKPADFGGLVGRFSIEANLSGDKVHVGDSVTLTVQLKGTGNVNRLPDLKMPDLDHLKTYADEPVFQTRAGADGLSGSKTMKWALVPDAAGDYTMPAFTISYFDPQTETYVTEKTQPLLLKVLPGEKQTLVTAPKSEKSDEPSKAAKKEVKEIGHDILPIYTSISGLKNDGWLPSKIINPGNWVCWAILLAPFGVYGLILLGLRFNRKSDTAINAQRARKAAQVFLKECRRGEKDANGMMTAVRDYINDRFELSLGALTPADVPKLLMEKGVSPSTAKSLSDVLEELEGRIYTGGEASCGSAFTSILEIIKRIEKELR